MIEFLSIISFPPNFRRYILIPWAVERCMTFVHLSPKYRSIAFLSGRCFHCFICRSVNSFWIWYVLAIPVGRMLPENTMVNNFSNNASSGRKVVTYRHLGAAAADECRISTLVRSTFSNKTWTNLCGG